MGDEPRHTFHRLYGAATCDDGLLASRLYGRATTTGVGFSAFVFTLHGRGTRRRNEGKTDVVLGLGPLTLGLMGLVTTARGVPLPTISNNSSQIGPASGTRLSPFGNAAMVITFSRKENVAL